ncbi:Xylanolytic transcriptional activator xlnR [Leucoagaricus sp. SymC.cos]|nr:Xylanolytic transcriptional activator xlnR [Leucoagaricus sp. SymC.cos]
MPYPSSHHYDDAFDSEETDPSFMFTSQHQHTQPSLYPTPTYDPPQNWPPYDQTLLPPFQSQPLPPYPAPYPVPRLTSPLNTAGGGHIATNVSRLSLAGSLDPTTGIFYRTPEHPRLRTAQACEKCRTRKAKCSGEHPSCKRCINRGLVCEYAKEGRVRGPNKAKSGVGVSTSSLKQVNAPVNADIEQNERTSSATSSISSSEQTGASSFVGDRRPTRDTPVTPISAQERSPSSPSLTSLDTLSLHSPPRLSFTPLSQHQSPHTGNLSQDMYSLSSSGAASESSSRRNSLATAGIGLGEHRASRPRPPDLGFDTADQWRPGNVGGSHRAGWSNQPSTGLNINDLVPEIPVDFQNSQRLYEQQGSIVREQHRYLQEQRRMALLQGRLPLHQQQSTPAGFDYQDIPHPPSLPTMTVPPLQHVNYGAEESTFQPRYQAYTSSEEYVYQRAVDYIQGPQSEIQVQGYHEDSQAASAMTHQESYQRSSTGLEAAEQGLHPSLSRIEKRQETFIGGANGEEHDVELCPLGASHSQTGVEGAGEQTRWV